MPDLSGHSRATEEEYFRRKEKELIEKLKEKAAAEAHRKGLAEAIGLENRQILDVLQEMGFDRSTVTVLFLVPLLQMAWSDGEVSEEERSLILQAARTHSVEEGSPAYQKLLGWLQAKPGPVLFDRALTVIQDLLRFQTGEAREATGTKLIDACEKVAKASGGFLGLGSKISAPEQAVLRRVVSAIGERHGAAAAKIESRLKS
jgi:DnaJ-domain-containing protein 1